MAGGFTAIAAGPPATETREGVRVLVADDHDLFRSGLRGLLADHGVSVIGEAARGDEAVRAARELAPDVVVMDLNMPVLGGVEATREIAAGSPLTRVVVLTVSDEEEDVMDAILAGACGYLAKSASIEELVAGIRAAAKGESLVSPHIAAKVLQRLRAGASAAPGDPGAAKAIRAELSEREIDVLKLVAAGLENAEIAAKLHISPKTVKNHLSNIFMKLQFENRIQAAVFAVRSGLV